MSNREIYTKNYNSEIITGVISLVLLTFALKILMSTNYISNTWLKKMEILNKVSLFNLLFVSFAGLLALECLVDFFNAPKRIIYFLFTICFLTVLLYLFFTAIDIDRMITDVLKEYFIATRSNAFYRGAYAIGSIVSFIVIMAISLNFVINMALKLKYILTLGKK